MCECAIEVVGLEECFCEVVLCADAVECMAIAVFDDVVIERRDGFGVVATSISAFGCDE